MNEQQQSRWVLRKKARREQGLPAANAQQMLFFVLSYHHHGQRTEGTNCLLSLMSLRTHCVAEPLKAATMQNFLHTWIVTCWSQQLMLLANSISRGSFTSPLNIVSVGRCRPRSSSIKSCQRASRRKASCDAGSTKFCAKI